jgi:hypothetical protein
MLPPASTAMLCGVWNCPGPAPRSPQDFSQLPSLSTVAVADIGIAGRVPGHVGHLAKISVARRQRRVWVLERRSVLVRGLLLAPEDHIDPTFRREFDHHVRALVGDPDVVLCIDFHGVGEGPGIKVVADFTQVIAVGVELQELRRGRAIGGAGCGAAVQDEDVPLELSATPETSPR